MAGDDGRSPPGPEDTEPHGHRVTPTEAAPGPEPSADLAADRPAEAFAAEPAPAAQEPPPRGALERRSALSAVLAVLGVIIVLMLGATLYTLYNPPADDPMRAAVADVGSLKQRVATIEAKPQQTVDLTPLDQRLTAVAADVARLKTDLVATAGRADAAAALAPKFAALQAAVAALPKVDLGPLESRVASLDGRIGDVATRVTANGDKLAALDKRIVPLEAYFNAPKSGERVTEARQNGSAAETRAAPMAVIAQGVLVALDEGRPFTAEADALGRLGVDAATLAPLKAVADKGAPTGDALVTGFAAVQDRTVVAASPVVETGTVLDRMMANAKGLVSVRRTGESAGPEPGAIASRIDADLKRGAFAAALTEWQSLPADSRAASSDWAAGLKARVEAAAAARTIQTKAVAALAAAP